MPEAIYDRKTFLEKLNLDENDLAIWERSKLISPVGFTEDKVPIYSEDSIQQVAQIQKLKELGYEPEAIRKIVKRVGLPSSGKPEKAKQTQENFLTVGGLAEKAGLSPRTLKHWETVGIIEPDMRTEGGFRLYSETYIFLCHLVQDLQRFGYSLEAIKEVSDYFREFLSIQEDLEQFSATDTENRLNRMTEAIDKLCDQMNLLKEGIQRWEDLLKKKRKEIQNLSNRNRKREKE